MPASPPGPLDLPNLKGKSILIVEDNDDHLELLSAFLKACRAQVFMVNNVDTALAYTRMVNPDMVISDLAMPGKDGIALITAIRTSAGRERTIPAIAITGFAENYADARTHGFDAFLRKPVRPEMLAKVLRDFFSR
jgi:CheY-like chemotaxis protein